MLPACGADAQAAFRLLSSKLSEKAAPWEGGGACTVFETVTLRVAVPVFPAASVATAVSVMDPFATVVVSSVALYGDEVSVLITVEPFRNWTEVTPTLSLAVAVIVMVPDTVAPLAGAVMTSDGAEVSGGGATTFEMVMERVAVPVFPAASVAAAVRVYEPLAKAVVSIVRP